MNLISNITLFTTGVGGIGAAVELAREGNFIGAAIAGLVGLASVYLYEKLPTS